MAKVSVAVKGQGYQVAIEFPAVTGDGFSFETISAQTPLVLGKAVDAAWLKAHAKPLEALVTKAMNVDIGQIENYRKTLLKAEVMTKTIRAQVTKAKLDEKAARALAEKLVTEDFAARWETFCKKTLPMGLRGCLKDLTARETAEVKAQLAKDSEVKLGDYSARPIVKILVGALATITGIVAAPTLPVAALALVAGLVGQGKIWIGHRKEISGKLAATRDAAAGVRSGADEAIKGLTLALKSLETMKSNLKLAQGAAALTEMEALAGQGAKLAALDAPAAAKARTLLEAASKARAVVAADLRTEAARLTEIGAALAAAKASAEQAAKLLGEGNKAWDGAMKKSETMLDWVDDALKGLGALK